MIHADNAGFRPIAPGVEKRLHSVRISVAMAVTPMTDPITDNIKSRMVSKAVNRPNFSFILYMSVSSDAMVSRLIFTIMIYR